MTGTPDPYAAFRLNLEQQRKRAKDLVRAIRARDREALSRLHTATDGRRAADDIKLTDAQFVVARELGFASGRELRRHIEALTAARAAMGHTPPPDARMPTLHVRCGSDIEQELLRAGFTGDFLSTWDAFTLGPVVSGTDWIEVRARFLAGGLIDLSYEDLLRELTEADGRLTSSATRYERIVLWMEHDSHDQLSLIRCLARYARIGPPRVLELISINHFPGSRRFIGLGQLPPEAMRLLWRRREAVGAEALALAADAWAAVTSDDPRRLAEHFRTGTRTLPHLAPALHRHLRELPSLENGLSLTEHLTLQMLDERPMTMAELWRTLHAEREPLPFLGDSFFLHIVTEMGRAAAPVFTRVPGEHAFQDRLSITDAGREVLRASGTGSHCCHHHARWAACESMRPARTGGGTKHTKTLCGADALAHAAMTRRLRAPRCLRTTSPSAYGPRFRTRRQRRNGTTVPVVSCLFARIASRYRAHVSSAARFSPR